MGLRRRAAALGSPAGVHLSRESSSYCIGQRRSAKLGWSPVLAWCPPRRGRGTLAQDEGKISSQLFPICWATLHAACRRNLNLQRSSTGRGKAIQFSPKATCAVETRWCQVLALDTSSSHKPPTAHFSRRHLCFPFACNFERARLPDDHCNRSSEDFDITARMMSCIV